MKLCWMRMQTLSNYGFNILQKLLILAECIFIEQLFKISLKNLFWIFVISLWIIMKEYFFVYIIMLMIKYFYYLNEIKQCYVIF